MKFTNRQIISQVFKFTKPFRKTLLIIFLIIVSTNAIEALNTYFLSKVFDIVQIGSDLNSALFYCSLAATFVLSKIILSRFRERIEVKNLDVYVDNYLNHESISKFFSFSNGQHINEHSGVKQSIIQSGFASIHNQMNMFIYNFIPSISQFVISIVVLFSINIYFGLSYFLASFLFALSLFKFNNKIDPKIRIVRDVRNKNSRFISEIYRFVFLIKNEVAENKSLYNLNKLQNNYQKEYSDTWLTAIDHLSIIRFSSQLFRWISIFIAVILVIEGMISSGSLFLVFLWSGNFINSIWNLTDMQKQFITDKINIEKYFELLNINPDIIIKENSKLIENIETIEFKDVCFAYPKRSNNHDSENEASEEYILNGVNFKIESGQKVAFVGESGSGKSTITNLLRRSFDSQLGSIKINETDLKDIQLKSFLSIIGSVDQEVIMFDTSLRENISFGVDRLLTDGELDDISKLSGVWKFKHKLEHGWDTIIGERGCKLSGGEKQRVGIARALAKNPELLIFDEATSALDTLSEMEVQESIEMSCKGKTSIIIAHRLSTVKDCDKIFVMKSGRILDSGKHSELLERCDYYKDLIKNQIGDKKVELGKI
jgi:ABC-type multidrug transport system fused ATPase/permease subunit